MMMMMMMCRLRFLQSMKSYLTHCTVIGRGWGAGAAQELGDVPFCEIASSRSEWTPHPLTVCGI